jgi:glycosyltransferase involved in cell wall biosynthesis
MDIAVAPFRPVENFYFSPLKLFEYLAMGKPVVASDVGQISEVIRDGDNGVLFEAGNVRSLAAALTRVATDDELRLTLASHAGSAITTWHDVARRAVALMPNSPHARLAR